jgi:hypothetical protein
MPGYLNIYLHTSAIRSVLAFQSVQPMDSDTLLILTISGSVIILVIVGAIAYIITQKRAMRELFDEFTENQEAWIRSRVASQTAKLRREHTVFKRLTAYWMQRSDSQYSLLPKRARALNLTTLLNTSMSSLETNQGANELVIDKDISAECTVLGDELILQYVFQNLIAYLTESQNPTTKIYACAHMSAPETRVHVTMSTDKSFTFSKTLYDHQMTNNKLAFCQMGIAAHGGVMEAATIPGKGTCFHFDLAAAIDGSSPQFDPLMQHANGRPSVAHCHTSD